MDFMEFVEDYYQQYIRVLNAFDKSSLEPCWIPFSMSETKAALSGWLAMAAVRRLVITLSAM